MDDRGRKRSLSGPCVSTPTKRKKYNCKYQSFWETQHPWLQKSDVSDEAAYCKVCKSNISIASGGLYDVKRHAKRATHSDALAAASKSANIGTFVERKRN